jgi:hypothetical protein
MGIFNQFELKENSLVANSDTSLVQAMAGGSEKIILLVLSYVSRY